MQRQCWLGEVAGGSKCICRDNNLLDLLFVSVKLLFLCVTVNVCCRAGPRAIHVHVSMLKCCVNLWSTVQARGSPPLLRRGTAHTGNIHWPPSPLGSSNPPPPKKQQPPSPPPEKAAPRSADPRIQKADGSCCQLPTFYACHRLSAAAACCCCLQLLLWPPALLLSCCSVASAAGICLQRPLCLCCRQLPPTATPSRSTAAPSFPQLLLNSAGSQPSASACLTSRSNAAGAEGASRASSPRADLMRDRPCMCMCRPVGVCVFEAHTAM